jgi:nitrogen regulatory protein PII
MVVAKEVASNVVRTIRQAAKTGRIGDGKIFVSPVESAIRIRTEERGTTAL